MCCYIYFFFFDVVLLYITPKEQSLKTIKFRLPWREGNDVTNRKHVTCFVLEAFSSFFFLIIIKIQYVTLWWGVSVMRNFVCCARFDGHMYKTWFESKVEVIYHFEYFFLFRLLVWNNNFTFFTLFPILPKCQVGWSTTVTHFRSCICIKYSRRRDSFFRISMLKPPRTLLHALI